MKRWIWLGAGVVVVGALLALGAARTFGRAGSRPATLLSVVTGWLAAWVLWGFAGGLGAHYGVLTYDGALFGPLAIAGGLWQYRTQTRQGRQQGLAVLVGGQLVWLVIVLWQNGVIR